MHDVAIIGAGLSGLAAATRLKERLPHLKVVVIEASEHVGGRCRSSSTLNGHTIDLGAHWVATSQTSILDVMKR